MRQERIEVSSGTSEVAELGGLVITARGTAPDGATLVVGRPGLPNLVQRLSLGDALLFETPDSGIIEVRVLTSSHAAVALLLSEVSRRPGLAAGFVDQDASNSAFSAEELKQLADSLTQIRTEMSARSDLTPEQLSLISRKLDEMRDAAGRLGRRDWMNLAIGTLTGVVVNAALPPDVGRALFRAADLALSWLFSGALRILPP
jgi:hypothetical protein